MSEPFENKDVSIVLPEAPDGDVTFAVTHEFGDAIASGTATLDTGTTYETTLSWKDLDAAGYYKVEWTAEFGGDEVVLTTSFYLSEKYISKDTFTTRNSYLSTVTTADFEKAELYARGLIDTYCGQNFQSYEAKTRTFYGTGRNNLHLDRRLVKLDSLEVDDVDYSAYVELDRRSHRFVRFKNDYTTYLFGDAAVIEILGDWGWSYVPQNVVDAADLLIQDLLSDDRASHKYNVREHDFDQTRTKYGNSMYETTGNLDADVLLMDYTFFELGYVSK